MQRVWPAPPRAQNSAQGHSEKQESQGHQTEGKAGWEPRPQTQDADRNGRLAIKRGVVCTWLSTQSNCPHWTTCVPPLHQMQSTSCWPFWEALSSQARMMEIPHRQTHLEGDDTPEGNRLLLCSSSQVSLVKGEWGGGLHLPVNYHEGNVLLYSLCT